MVQKICLLLLIIGGLNWGIIGIFNFNTVAWIFGGGGSIFARIIYTVVGLAALVCIPYLCSKNCCDSCGTDTIE